MRSGVDIYKFRLTQHFQGVSRGLMWCSPIQEGVSLSVLVMKEEVNSTNLRFTGIFCFGFGQKNASYMGKPAFSPTGESEKIMVMRFAAVGALPMPEDEGFPGACSTSSLVATGPASWHFAY